MFRFDRSEFAKSNPLGNPNPDSSFTRLGTWHDVRSLLLSGAGIASAFVLNERGSIDRMSDGH